MALHILHGVVITLTDLRQVGPEMRRERVRWWALKLLRLLDIGLEVHGQAIEGGALLVGNHISWLDIHVIHAVWPRARFVSKADVQRWPVLNRLADAAGTLYLQRERPRDAKRIVHQIAEALHAGDTVAVFPEGTTGAGRVLLPFHANLLQGAISAEAPLQPFALRYGDAHGPVSDAVVYVGDTSLMRSLWWVACARDLRVDLHFLEPLDTAGGERRALAALARDRIGTALD